MTWWNLLLWTFFFLGVVFPFGVKFSLHMHKTDSRQYSFLVNVGRFFFDFDDYTVITRSATTLAAEWVIGSIYIDKLPIPLTGYLAELPKHPALACLLGFLAELIAPWLLGIIMNAMPSKKKEE